ncbi:hypothetical protein MBAV_004724 [Candidatus Magnetobacterium bavaricum]|uniref:Uncharacterized protein n=1 Tax=Candidatus Magnetobacterium bavaricum TaxID=29290 RepID=A0A0F3GMN3_9BACT|nr:hypothetical protein MBAV_004724 [Candidatus Magnetobacterium bavaricum]
MDIFLNELSFKEADNKEQSHEWIRNLLQIYKVAESKGFTGLKVPSNFTLLPLADDYKVGDFIHDEYKKRKDEIDFILGISYNEPYIDDIINREDQNKNRIHEFLYNGLNAYGFGAAHLLDSMSISLDNDPQWNKPSIGLLKSFLDDETNAIVKEHININHISNSQHLNNHQKWIENKKKEDIPNGKILWLKRKDKFPNLIFCEDIQKQISDLEKIHFIQVKKDLFELDDFCLQYKKGPIDIHQFPKLTPESENRLNEFRDKLTFKCPDEKKRLFSLHIRYTPGAGRLYVHPYVYSDNHNRLIIGYIGKKIE